MPFLKCIKESVTKSRIEACIRNGPRGYLLFPYRTTNVIYKGDWLNDQRHGKGVELIEATGLQYEGEWSHDKKHGYGELRRIFPDKNRKKIYTGNWVNGKKDGFGRMWYKSGGFYEGDFKENERHGFGRMWKHDGTFYQGTWKNNVYHGDGMLILANGNRYEGYFSNGKKEGRGIFYHIETGQFQDGCWLDDKCEVSTVEDIHWRQSARVPTPYPIPKVRFDSSSHNKM
ncbi:MORN repeat-containing protein 3-like [Venturia canescens]|uniref:MORN repeat-containing protein 3-like n=1 Tax=Venturia canescens TaxID=32260 RepID=UPI001C9CDA31|nr:MORN repeat-containing protein 3-like [Venturia canescens]